MGRRSPPRKVTYFEPVPPRLARNTIIESTFEVGRSFRCTMRVDCGQLEPGAVIQPVPGEWHPRMPECLDDEELAYWRAGRNAVYQLAALTIGARLAVADASGAALVAPPSALSATRSTMTRPRADRRTAPSFGRYLSAFAAQFLHACPDQHKVVSGSGPAHILPVSCDPV